MGRGLSDLQQNILLYALERKIERDNQNYEVSYYLNHREVLVRFYHFRSFIPYEKAGTRQPIFDRAAIGMNRYKSATVAVVKSFNRLCNRGLMYHNHAFGIKLTPEGEQVAHGLLKVRKQKGG